MRVVVLGASLAGLLAAAATAAVGAETVVLERDRLPTTPEARRGVPQGRQPHVLLHRGLLSASTLLPGLRDDLVAAGASVFNGGEMPALGEYGWLPTWLRSYDLVSLTRPLMEHVVRGRVAALPGVRIVEGVRGTGLKRSGSLPREGGRPPSNPPTSNRWRVALEDGDPVEADLVIDASGRGSRLPHWLAELGVRVPAPQVVDAQLGYACRRYRAVGEPPLTTGIVIATTPDNPRGALALPVEHGDWLVIASGYGPHRPGRTVADFDAYLDALPDPAIRDLVDRLEPVTDVAAYRQTSNRRHRYGLVRDWPAGLLVVGDAACAFNPVYGQGITVAAQQALKLREGLGRAGRGPLGPPDLQRRLDRVADFCWAAATGEDLRQPSCAGSPSAAQQVAAAWSAELARLAVAGDERAYWAFAQVYHLMVEPRALLDPALVAAVARARVRGHGPPAPRPAVLDRLRTPLAA